MTPTSEDCWESESHCTQKVKQEGKQVITELRLQNPVTKTTHGIFESLVLCNASRSFMYMGACANTQIIHLPPLTQVSLLFKG